MTESGNGIEWGVLGHCNTGEDVRHSVSTKSPPRRANARGHGTEGIASMQRKRTALVQVFLDEYCTARDLAPFYRRRRPTTFRALGALLHPAAVTEAWHAADCPPRLDTALLPFSTRVRWWVGMVLRGARLS